ncbi:IS66 family transposase [Echinicola soli]|uniref:IS66 family transposase n=1 Tax=Echinicola soli TaxID=2591634 RepID=A0A514CKW8_9BACT|nr:IS66 family transposase [Echinicola soli]QDH80440.1 IS66 family transposase [Echinicola soli]
MDTSLEHLSREQLIALIGERDRVIGEKEAYECQLLALIDKFKRMAFAQKRERFEGNKDQMALPFETAAAGQEAQKEVFEQKTEYTRRKQASAHPGRVALPEHLPVEEVEIKPEGDLSGMVCIGKEVTEELDYIPGRHIIRRYIRYKYAPKDKNSGSGVLIGKLPERVIDKGIPGAGLLASILTDKYGDHLPLYRQLQRFKRENIKIAASTMDGWVRQALERLEPLYDCLLGDTKAMGYLQADETTIKVMDGAKKGACHLGYYWTYHNPLEKTVLFDYQPTRGSIGAENLLKGFKGYLQTDGYATYKKLGKQEGVTHLACWAHARREFFDAMTNDKKRAEKALEFIGKLYAVEREAKENNLVPDAVKKLRLDESLQVINSMSEWIKEQLQDQRVLPGSAIGKALRYSAERWDELSNYLYDGRLEIDNNLVENAIRPVALGRKNYLFAGSHKAAQRAAMIYSFFAICKKHEVNPYEWLKYTLQNIMTIKQCCPK